MSIQFNLRQSFVLILFMLTNHTHINSKQKNLFIVGHKMSAGIMALAGV